MSKAARGKKLYALLIGVLAVAYNLLLFLLKRDFVLVSWIAYAFTMLWFVILIVDVLIPESKLSKHPMFGIPASMYAWFGFIMQLLFGFLMLLIDEFPLRLAVIIEVVLLTLYAVRILMILLAKNEIEAQDEHTKQKRFYIQNMSADLNGVLETIKDEKLREAVKSLAEEVRYSDPMSHEALAPLEERIHMNVESLRDAVDVENTEEAMEKAQLVGRLLRERNQKCLMLK